MFRPILVLLLVIMGAIGNCDSAQAAEYGIVVSKETLANPQWKQVVEALQTKHDGEVIT